MDFSVKEEQGRLWGYNEHSGEYEIMLIDSMIGWVLVPRRGSLGVDPEGRGLMLEGVKFDSYGEFVSYREDGLEKPERARLTGCYKLLAERRKDYEKTKQNAKRVVSLAVVLYAFLFACSIFVCKLLAFDFGSAVDNFFVYAVSPVVLVALVGAVRMTNAIMSEIENKI